MKSPTKPIGVNALGWLAFALVATAAAQQSPAQVPQAPADTRQATPAATPRFAVVSIKQSGAGERTDFAEFLSGRAYPGVLPGGAYRANRYALISVITAAYHDYLGGFALQESVIGVPAWVMWTGNTFFDISAKADEPYPSVPYTKNIEQVCDMLQTMLADRFRLRVHREDRDVDGYRLEVVDANGVKKLKAATFDSDGMAVDQSFGSGSYLPGWTTEGRGWFGSPAISMRDFANELSSMMGKPAVDATGIQGMFSIRLEMDPTPQPGPGARNEKVAAALEQEYGLRLVAAKVPWHVLVIDSVSLPIPN